MTDFNPGTDEDVDLARDHHLENRGERAEEEREALRSRAAKIDAGMRLDIEESVRRRYERMSESDD